MNRPIITALLCLPCVLLATAAEIESVHFGYGTFTDRTPPSGPFNNGPFPAPPLSGPTFSSAKLSDNQVTLLNNATVSGLANPVDGIFLQRIVKQVDPVLPGSMIPPSSFYQKTDAISIGELFLQ